MYAAERFGLKSSNNTHAHTADAVVLQLLALLLWAVAGRDVCYNETDT